MKGRITGVIIMIVSAVIIINYPFIKSITVMSVYNRYQINKSIMKKYDIDIDINKPEGKWYPLMNCFAAEGFSDFSGKDTELTILYCFPGFEYGSSKIFRKDSKLYTSYYGCYIIDNESGYGFNDDNELNADEIIKIPYYDFKYLVTSPLGKKIDEITTEIINISHSKQEEFHELSLQIRTNGLSHSYKEYNSNYIQYGYPLNSSDSEQFEKILLYSKMYVVRKDNYDLIYYFFSPTEKLVKDWKYY